MNKGQIFEGWKKKYIWILQDVLFENLVSRFGLTLNESIDNENFIIFYTVSMSENKEKNIFRIQPQKIYSTNIEELSRAYQRGPVLPINEFIESIKRKAEVRDKINFSG
jgi:hypothetical protein